MQKIGIVGAGAMGSGIGLVAGLAHCEVILYDQSKEQLTKAQQYINSTLNKLEQKGKISPEEAVSIEGNIYFVESLSSFKDCQLIIEAIVEQLEAKQLLLKGLESIVSPDCVLASNTSSLSITAIAQACQHSERVIGIHFFNPPYLMPLVEIIPGLSTASGLASTVCRVIQGWGKLPVIVKDTPGFIVNRVARPYYSEALRIYDEQIADAATIDFAMTSIGGFRMGPFTLMDFIGHDVNFAVTESMFHAFYGESRYKPSLTQRRLVDAGWLGRKKNRGFYKYDSEDFMPYTQADSAMLKSIFERIIVQLINEAADALYFGIASKEDIDLAMTKGVNYPKGLLRWGDELGIDWVVQKIDGYFAVYHEERYRCSPLLRQMSQLKQKFYPI
jgi:3-hydroxybutyryl-CoA dehydrogenase